MLDKNKSRSSQATEKILQYLKVSSHNVTENNSYLSVCSHNLLKLSQISYDQYLYIQYAPSASQGAISHKIPQIRV